MEVTKKSCRWCAKDFIPKAKQQRYCGDVCAYSGKKKANFRAYLEGKERKATQPTFSTMYGLDWAKDNDLSGLNLGKERYQE